ncbi:hypothetical protein D4R99_01455 [bacterium]|nr:MAG: hypothetical protein D4R99_01455 [bacterium]
MGKTKISPQTILIIGQIITAILIVYSIHILVPQINYWKEKYALLQQEHGNKISEFQAFLSFLTKKVEILEKENVVLKENNVILTKKLEDFQNKVSIAEKDPLQNELTDIKQSLETLSLKLQNQTANISEVKTGLKTASETISRYNSDVTFVGDVVFADGTGLKGCKIFDFNPGPVKSMDRNETSVGYSSNLAMAINSTTNRSRRLEYSRIKRIDVIPLTPSENEMVRNADADSYDKDKLIKCSIVFHDGNTMNTIFLVPHYLRYDTANESGSITRETVKALIFPGPKDRQ